MLEGVTAKPRFFFLFYFLPFFIFLLTSSIFRKILLAHDVNENQLGRRKKNGSRGIRIIGKKSWSWSWSGKGREGERQRWNIKEEERNIELFAFGENNGRMKWNYAHNHNNNKRRRRRKKKNDNFDNFSLHVYFPSFPAFLSFLFKRISPPPLFTSGEKRKEKKGKLLLQNTGARAGAGRSSRSFWPSKRLKYYPSFISLKLQQHSYLTR